MNLSKNNPIIRLSRGVILRKGFQRRMPAMIRYGGWLPLAGYSIVGMKVLLLTTTGRKTGKSRTSPILYIHQGQDYIISAHQAGHNRHPSWYLNLVANPNVSVELYWRSREYYAEEIMDMGEREALLAQFPFGLVGAFQEHTARTIPVIRLRPPTIVETKV